MADGVNLDALISRADFETDGGQFPGSTDTRITMSNLAGDTHWVQSLRKPDFQRETANWGPQKIADFIAAYLNGDLIPAIILWRSGHLAFVIDGAHRLSAMLAWIYDDYGQGARSMRQYDDGQIPEEQLDLANQTRDLVNKQIGTYASFRDIWNNIAVTPAPAPLQKRLGGFQHNGFVAQWVPSMDAEGAQNAFFTINQKQTPIDPTEETILAHRRSASALATRAIHRGGAGHKYWQAFADPVRKEIEITGKEINQALYSPPMGKGPVKTSDVPVAGRGYASLPFVFDLVNLSNGVSIKKPSARRSSAKGKKKLSDHAAPDLLAPDMDGKRTVAFLETVRRRVRRITTDHAGSLGLHPLVYFYTRGGKFQPNTFLAILPVIDRLAESGNLEWFCEIRKPFEDFILNHKEAFTLIVKSQGSGGRSRPAVGKFLELVMEGLWEGKSEDDIIAELGNDKRYYQIARPKPPHESGSGGGFSKGTKTAAFVSKLFETGVRCGICGALVHRNAMHTDHKQSKRDGGDNSFINAQIAHPFCDSTYKDWKALAVKPKRRKMKDEPDDEETAEEEAN